MEEKDAHLPLSEKESIMKASLMDIELNDEKSQALARKIARWTLVGIGIGCAASGFYGVFSGSFSDVIIGTLFTSALSTLTVALNNGRTHS